MSWILFFTFIACFFALFHAEIHYHDFNVRATTVTRLCKTHDIITVNGEFPGPTLKVRNGDTLVVTVVNYSQYNVTIHWHGVRQMRTGWADGPEWITQCPIRPGASYTYRFTIKDQEGTLWWHAHSSWLRASVYGALIIYPMKGDSYPILGEVEETQPIILGEWWNTNPMDVINAATRTGAAPNISDAFTINSQPGDLYPCSSQDTYKLKVQQGKTYLLRLINAAMNAELFFKIADHIMMVVAVDASYAKPLHTDVIVVGPGQTTDFIIITNKPPNSYYMAARAYASAQRVPFDNTTATAILEYSNYPLGPRSGSGLGLGFPTPPSITKPVMPNMPFYNDTATATEFNTGLRSLANSEHPVRVPQEVDEDLLVTVGIGMTSCPSGQTCGGPGGNRFAASMNNVSFVFPNTVSLLQAHYYGVPGVFSRDFPDKPPLKFDYTARNVSTNLWFTEKGTKLKPLKFNSAVQVVLQGTNIFSAESHPIHLHGYDFYIVGEGFGNFNAAVDSASFNLVDPPMRNTVSVPVNGWAVIRFVADNPGVWIMHCHLDVHITWGLATAFIVENGHHLLSKIGPPPLDLPLC